MMNLDNFGLATGRLVNIPAIFSNHNRSRTVRFTIAVPNSYTNADGSRSSQFLPFTDFIPANAKTNGIYDNLEVEYLSPTPSATTTTRTPTASSTTTCHFELTASSMLRPVQPKKHVWLRMSHNPINRSIPSRDALFFSTLLLFL